MSNLLEKKVEWTVCAYDMFMSATLLVRVAKLTGSKSLLKDAVKQIENIHHYLWDEKVGCLVR
ncbi:MAG: hypothetical protein GXO85_06690 [Chlorobi bacterium]|nr:hypothetical protein [Chlorobiota bacterium]